MTPTTEQHDILNTTGRVVRINARAGTGKTTTLQMLAQQHRRQRILYLVFNRQAREEAKKNFPTNVDVLTVHALAYKNEGYKWKDRLGHFSPADMLFAFQHEEQLPATLSHDFLVYFLNSPFPRLEDAVATFLPQLPDHVRDLFQHYQQRIIAATRAIATAWNTGQKPCPHDFYLKLCHKSGKFQAALKRYDIILIDEAQDLSPIMLDALRSYPKRLILVGDSHQQIYSFRYAVNAMQNIDCVEECELSLSFRFGNSIAELVSTFIQEAKNERRFRIKGNPQTASRVGIYQHIEEAPHNTTSAVLSRSNVALFENAIALKSQDMPFRFERDIYPLLMRTLDVYWLAEEKPSEIHDSLIRSFHELDALDEYAKTTDNFQVRGMIHIVKKYREEFPDVIFALQNLTQFRKEEKNAEGIILSTIHSAKGQEYEKVYIDADMAENLETVGHNEPEESRDEINVAYVGFTRAKNALHLPQELQTALTPRWANLLKQYQNAPERNFQPGDRVLTPLGPGTLLEIGAKKCLVNIATRNTAEHIRIADLR